MSSNGEPDPEVAKPSSSSGSGDSGLMPPPLVPPPKLSIAPPPKSPVFVKPDVKKPNEVSTGLLGADLAMPSKQKLGGVRKHSAENGLPAMSWFRRTSEEIPIKRPEHLRAISSAELKQHNKKNDCWMALQGHVYDVTEYIPYHPGGVPEIMKGAGIDGTALFNSIHRYVNFESLLAGNQVGVYSRRPTILEGDEERAINFIPRSMVHRDSVDRENLGLPPKKKCWGCKVCDFCRSREKNLGLVPVTTFLEDDNYVTYKVSLQGFKYNRDYWSVALLEKEKLLLKVITKPPDMWMAYFQLAKTVTDDSIEINFTNRYKNLIVKIPKAKKEQWKKLGEPLPDHNEIEDSRRAIEDLVPASIIRRESIGKFIFFITIKLHHSGRVGAPIGFDVKFKINDNSRRYTPVCPLFHKDWEVEDPKHQILHFIYKMYLDGTLTPLLSQLPVYEPSDVLEDDEMLLVGASSGNLDTDWLQGADGLILLAAGSGITPYIRIIKYLIEHNIALGIDHVILIHWNKTEDEIIWRKEFEQLQQTKSWFHFIPILTREKGEWNGIRGRISDKILKQCLDLVPKFTKDKTRIRWMSCGTDGFNTNATKTIESMGYSPDSVFVFLG